VYVWVSVKLYVCLHVCVWVLVYVWVCVIRHIEWCSNCFTKRASLSGAPPASMSAGCELFFLSFLYKKRKRFSFPSHTLSLALSLAFSLARTLARPAFFSDSQAINTDNSRYKKKSINLCLSALTLPVTLIKTIEVQYGL